MNCHSKLPLQRWCVLFTRAEKMTLNSFDDLRKVYKTIKLVYFTWSHNCDWALTVYEEIKSWARRNKMSYLLVDIDR